MRAQLQQHILSVGAEPLAVFRRYSVSASELVAMSAARKAALRSLKGVCLMWPIGDTSPGPCHAVLTPKCSPRMAIYLRRTQPPDALAAAGRGRIGAAGIGGGRGGRSP